MKAFIFGKIFRIQNVCSYKKTKGIQKRQQWILAYAYKPGQVLSTEYEKEQNHCSFKNFCN